MKMNMMKCRKTYKVFLTGFNGITNKNEQTKNKIILNVNLGNLPQKTCVVK